MNGDPEGASAKLLEISYQSLGLSGRSLRKIPFLAYALYLRKEKYTVSVFLDAMKIAIAKQKDDMDKINEK